MYALYAQRSRYMNEIYVHTRMLCVFYRPVELCHIHGFKYLWVDVEVNRRDEFEIFIREICFFVVWAPLYVYSYTISSFF